MLKSVIVLTALVIIAACSNEPEEDTAAPVTVAPEDMQAVPEEAASPDPGTLPAGAETYGDYQGDTPAAIRAGQDMFDATGMVPCARSAGQPMGQCDMGVARGASGEAAVIVTHPDGFKRALFFENGDFLSADTSEADGYPAYSASKNADLYVISVGDERYEVPEAVIFGG